jgi:putative spermidine/putrescine transport system permease protein
MSRRARHWLLVTLAVWSVAPVLMLLVRAVAPAWRYPDLLPAAASVPLASSGAARRVAAAMGTSLVLALFTGPAAALIGFVLARGIARARPIWRRIATSAALLPVIASPIALGVGLQVFALELGVSGTMLGVWLAHLVPAIGYVTLFAAGVLTAFDLSLEEEARTLGATRWQAVTRVTLPLLRRRLAEAMVLGALVSWGQLALTLLIGGGIVRTLPVELLSLVRSGNDQHGALAALVLSVPPALALGLLQVGARRTGAAL